MSLEEGRVVFERYRRFAEDATKMIADGIPISRQFSIRLAEGFEIGDDVVTERVDAGGVPAEWVRTNASQDDTVLLYFHGGGYVTGCIEAYRHFVADLSRRTGATGLTVDYALAPERPFPQAVEDAVLSYRFLLDRGIDPRRIIVSGDSAGGGLSLALLLSLKDAGLPQPAGAWLLSPITDAEVTGESNVTQAHLDPIAVPPIPKNACETYLAGASPRHPLASPMYADLEGLPPLRIDVGTHETLLDDSIRFARQAAICEVRLDLAIWPGMVHVFPFFGPILEEGRVAIEHACAFFNRRLNFPDSPC